MSDPDLNASGLLILTAKHGGTDGRAPLHEEYVMGRPCSGVGNLMFPTETVIRAAEDGWIELTREGRGVVCQPTERGWTWMDRWTDRDRARRGR